jgi:toxin YoeB
MIRFRRRAWEDYLYWQQTDKRILRRINELIKDIQRQPFAGLGKPEPLKHQFSGLWSRRIDDEHRLVYTLMDDEIVIVQCRYHY